MIRSLLSLASLALGITVAWSAAFALPLAPGGAVTPVGTGPTVDPNLGGPVVSDSLLPFQVEDADGNVIVEGVLQDRVIRSDNLGTLIFAPRLRDTTGSGVIVGLVDRGFAGFSTDADYSITSIGNVAPDEISRSADGDALTFEYEPSVIDPPEAALAPNVLTDATDFAAVGTTTIFARDVAGALYFVTLENTNTPVPEPSTLVLVGLGVVALAAARRRGSR